MNSLEQRIAAFLRLGRRLREESDGLNTALREAELQNRWFIPEYSRLAIENICNDFLQEEKLRRWLSAYDLAKGNTLKVGLIMAGNIPLVGFHDFLCVALSGHHALLKLSSKDEVLFQFVLGELIKADGAAEEFFSVVNHLREMQAVIATGSNNSARSFEFYFAKYPHIIRKNRNAVAVLTGRETRDELESLGLDVFNFFGLGCRNVSKLLVPRGFNFSALLDSFQRFESLNRHNKYKNNYDYQRAILLLNKTPHLASDFLILKEDAQLLSPVATLHYEYYENDNERELKLARDREVTQCVIGKNHLPFGQSQSPALSDYADGVDTMKFLQTAGKTH
jgi:hypothetical protein